MPSPSLLRKCVSVLLVAVLALRVSVAHAQANPDTVRLLQRVVTAESEANIVWLRTWVQSEADRHSVNIPFPSDLRFTNTDGTIVHRRSAGGYLNDTLIFTKEKPLYRAENISCRPLDQRWGPGVASNQTPREVALKVPWVILRYGNQGLIESRITGFSVCPTWYQGPERSPPWDERLGVDRAISPKRLNEVRIARAQVLFLLDSAVRRMPHNNWLIGQYVRLLVEQGRKDDASNAAAQCQADAWWCGLLQSYASYHVGNSSNAYSEMTSAFRQMDTTTRCNWSDTRELLPQQIREVYEHLSCQSRDSVNTVLWWLADPLWSEPGNDREAEQVERRLLLTLRSALGRDERFDWHQANGSDARAEMVMRYGWPAYMYWRGLLADSIRSGFLHIQKDINGNQSPTNVPYVSYEYGAGRLHLVPAAQALWNPFNAQSQDWSIASGTGGDSAIHFELPRRIDDPMEITASRFLHENALYFDDWQSRVYPDYAKHTLWWPNEHYAAPRKLVQLPEAQVALLRRQNNLLFATATQFDTIAGHARGTTIDSVTLIITPHPDTILFPVRTRATVGDVFVMRTTLPSRPTMVGIEFPASSEQQSAGRTRFGITPPATLSGMQPNDRAISDPVVLRVPANKAATKNAAPRDEFVLTTNIDSALTQMAPTATITKGSALGLYWETYGYTTTDSVSIAVRMQRTTPGEPHPTGFFRRLTSDANTPVVVRWSETQTSRNARSAIDNVVPIIGRSIIVNTAGLSKGDYWLNISVESPNHAIVVSSKQIHVQ
ncbi:MAG: hypothetical protein ABJC26_06660 [Gemmatimonadaceae bacterium]